jgi:hypothetical protein
MTRAPLVEFEPKINAVEILGVEKPTLLRLDSISAKPSTTTKHAIGFLPPARSDATRTIATHLP